MKHISSCRLFDKKFLMLWTLLLASSAAGLQNQAGSGSAQPKYGPAGGCVPPTLVDPEPKGVLIPELAPGKKPNFIVILTDDQGWDDVGLHHPQVPGRPAFVNTPNMDRFLKHGIEFNNFYVTPMCAQTRAALLTGRSHPRTGTMLVSGGYDFISRDEATAGEVMRAAGYQTAHFGKWHNGRSLGYEPWHVGFQESWMPEQYIHLDNLMNHNGEYIQTYGLMEQVLMDKVLTYLDYQVGSSDPFFMYYAPNAIHRGYMRPGVGPQWTRPSPEPYKAKYRPLGPKYNISGSTVEVWAMLEYMDDVLGRLFDYMDNSPLKETTYVMIMSDNGSELFLGEMRSKGKRMPSGMQGYKRDVEEGGVRNFLGVQGPGIQSGVIDSTLLDIVDILPTMVDLAGISADAAGISHWPWDGISFKNLLLTGNELPVSPGRGTSKASQQQLERFVFSMGPLCWDSNSVPQLDANRNVIRPQSLLDYDAGGFANRELLKYYNMSNMPQLHGFEHCLGVRYKEYKWIGRTGKVYKFQGESHIELPCNEVSGPESENMAAIMSAAARDWFKSMVAEPHSFAKPTFYLGLDGWAVTNLLPDGAHERTPGRVGLMANGASGFVQPGDRTCFAVEVLTAGTYEVVLIYTSKVEATFRLSVGPYADIKNKLAPAITVQLPVLSIIGGQFIGNMYLHATPGTKHEACLQLEATTAPGKPVFANLGVIRFTRLDPMDGSSVGVSSLDPINHIPVKGRPARRHGPGGKNPKQPGTAAKNAKKPVVSGRDPKKGGAAAAAGKNAKMHQQPAAMAKTPNKGRQQQQQQPNRQVGTKVHQRPGTAAAAAQGPPNPAAAAAAPKNAPSKPKTGGGTGAGRGAAVIPVAVPAPGLNIGADGEYRWLVTPPLEKGGKSQQNPKGAKANELHPHLQATPMATSHRKVTRMQSGGS